MKKRFFACLLAVCMLVAMLPTVAFAGVTYADVAGHWAEEAIYAWSDKGIVNGVGKDANGVDLFNPDGLLTREQAAAIFARLLKLEKTADVSFFKDVEAGAWYVDGIAKCYAAGIINGTGADTFGTGAYLTRADMFTMFCRALGVEGQDACDKVFDDAREVPAYAQEYTNALVNLGYVGGVTATTLQPLANITRAQMVSLLNKAIVGYITEDGEYEIDEDGIVLVVGEGLEVALSGKGAVTAVVTGDETEIDVTEMTKADKITVVVKGASDVKAKASAGTTIVTMDAEDTTVNGEDLDKSDEIVVEEEKKPASSSSSSNRTDRDECRHSERFLKYTDNGDGTHDLECTNCNDYYVYDEFHIFDEEGKCPCGAVEETEDDTTGGSTTGGSTTGGSTTGGSTTGGSTTGGSTTGGSTTGGSTTGGSTTGGSTTGGSTTGGSTTGGSTTGDTTTGGTETDTNETGDGDTN